MLLIKHAREPLYLKMTVLPRLFLLHLDGLFSNFDIPGDLLL